MKWYYAVGGQPVGPVTRAELELLFSSGAIDPNTMIVQEGMYDWVSYRDLKKTTQFLFTVPAQTAETVETVETFWPVAADA